MNIELNFNTSNVFVAHLPDCFRVGVDDYFNTSNVFVAPSKDRITPGDAVISIHLMCSLPMKRVSVQH